MTLSKNNISRTIMHIFAALALITVTGLGSAFAISNPLIRNCVINGGVFEVHPVGTLDDMALCRWNQVVVDSQTLLSNLDGITTEAASILLSDITSDSCQGLSAGETMLPNGQTLCLFQDDSKLSLDTAKAGLSDPDRLRLKEVLSTR